MWFPNPIRSRAVLIGASRFDSVKLPNIPSAANNVNDLRKALTDWRTGTISWPHCAVPTDSLTVAGAGQVLRTARDDATDLLLVYYAGHGLLDNAGRLYLALRETDVDRLDFTAIPIDTLKRDLSEAKARARVLILDCCFSGRAIAAMSDPSNLATGQLFVAGTYTLTSTTATAPSHAPVGSRNTSFTAALLDGLAQPVPLPLDTLADHIDLRLAGAGLPRPQRQATNTAGQVALVRGPTGPGQLIHLPARRTTRAALAAFVLVVSLLVGILANLGAWTDNHNSATDTTTPYYPAPNNDPIDTTTTDPLTTQPPTTVPTTTGFDPTSLDDVATDQTPITAAALFPASFGDDQGDQFSMDGSAVVGCAATNTASNISTWFTQSGCQQSVVADYIQNADATGPNPAPLVVSVEIMPFPNLATATTIQGWFSANTAADAQTRQQAWYDMTLWCHQTGQLVPCPQQPAYPDWHRYLAVDHRYLVYVQSLHMSTTQDDSVGPRLDSADVAAAQDCGPQNYHH